MVVPSISTCVIVGAVAVFAVAGPASKPSSIQSSAQSSSLTQSSTQSADVTLPDSFAIFRTVNPFSSKRHPTSAGAAAEKGGPEASIILDGVAQTGIGWTAFFNSGKGNPALMLSVGDPIARGHIQSVDLDSVTYVCGEQSQHVEVGQNLNGETPPPTSQPAPEKEHKNGRQPNGQPQGDQPQNGQPPNSLPPDGQPPQNAQPTQDN